MDFPDEFDPVFGISRVDDAHVEDIPADPAPNASVAFHKYPDATCIVLYFKPGCDIHQMPGDQGDRIRDEMTSAFLRRFLDVAEITCKLDREAVSISLDAQVFARGTGGQDNGIVRFVLHDLVLDEVIAQRLGHTLWRSLSAYPAQFETDNGSSHPAVFCGFGMCFL